jgi:hypothetical protein
MTIWTDCFALKMRGLAALAEPKAPLSARTAFGAVQVCQLARKMESGERRPQNSETR